MSVFESLVRRMWPKWPDWRCYVIESGSGLICNRPAAFMFDPVPGAAVKWTVCSQHAPPDAAPIPPDMKYWVQRLELKVSVCAPPGTKTAALDAAIRNIAYAIEGAGGIITAIKAPGKTASRAPAEPLRERLELAGPPMGLEPDAAPGEAPARPSAIPWRRSRTGSA